MWGRWGMQPEGQVQGLLSSVSPAPCKDLGRVGLAQVPSEQSRTELTASVRLDSPCSAPLALPHPFASLCSVWGGLWVLGLGAAGTWGCSW